MSGFDDIARAAASGGKARCSCRHKARDGKAQTKCAFCRGTGTVEACPLCDGSGFNPKTQKACVQCGGRGCR